MKSYLARLVARATPPAENLPAPHETISDPFADAALAAPRFSSQISREDSPLRPPPSAHPLPESAFPEMSEVRPPSLNLKDQTPLPTTPISSSKQSAANVRQKSPTLIPRPSESRDHRSYDNADKTEVQESAPLKPRDDDLLRVADRFMEKLQTNAPEAPASATLKPAEAPLPLLPRESPGNRTQSYRTQAVDPTAPSLHIGNLRVDIIETNAASIGPVRSSAPKFIVRNGARASRTGPILRQRFGLRQL